MPTDSEHERHQVFDICQDGNIDRVTRVMDLVVSHARELLFPYSKVEVDENEEREDSLNETETYVIELRVPDDFSKTTATYLEKLIHDYIVYKVLEDWLVITNLKNPKSGIN